MTAPEFLNITDYGVIGRGFKSATPASPWGNGNVVNIDIPDVDNMTKEEAEAWIIRNNLTPILEKVRPLTPQQNITNALISKTTPDIGDMIGTLPEARQEKLEPPKVEVKQKPKRRFKVGERYCLSLSKNKKLRYEYEVKKTIYTIEEREVRIVIMKQIKGDTHHTKFCLNRRDCLAFHIKYEDGLEVFSMDLDWKLLNKKEKKL